MKSKMFLFFSFLLLTVSVTIVSCGDDKEDDPKPEASMTAKIDGVDWKADEAGATYIQNKFNLTGKKGDVIMTFTLSDIAEAAKGTFPLALTNIAAYYNPAESASSSTTNGDGTAEGTFTITAVDTQDSTVTGTFSATVLNPLSGNTKEITAGKFSNVKWTTTIPNTGNDEFSVKIDGVLWQPPRIFAVVAYGKLSLAGTSADGSKAISIGVPTNVTPGTYSLSTFGDYSGSYNQNASTYLGADSGSLIITEHDVSAKKISGTFAFEASTLDGAVSASLTEGSFSIKY